MRTPFLQLLTGAYSLLLKVAPGTLTSDRTLNIDADWQAGYLPQIDPNDPNVLTWVPAGNLGGGSVSNVSVDTDLNSVLTVTNSTTTPELGLLDQSANTVFASPGGVSGKPTFRTLLASDLPVGQLANTVAAGDDTRFHTQNTDLGTDSPTFKVDLGGADELALLATAAGLQISNPALTGVVGLLAKNLQVNGDFNHSIYLDTVDSKVKLGVLDAGYTIARVRRIGFTSADVLGGGLVNITHALGGYVLATVYDNGGLQVYVTCLHVNDNVLQLQLGDVTVTGTWTVVIYG